ncbi:hypothetical protein F0562_031247 [Nyssa sinensis]|uniref:Uncharacterized protein n=1 Tax=Nyssa sinensis TaxID=561372 RepID=A0A5J5AT76_9ASTE|nr:hypothetical protein F0562_031247 [Nyssa sinensis]
MRTRFLNVDYFNSASIQATETLEFLRLPLPQLPPSNLSNFEDIRCFDDVSALDVSLEIDRFQIHESLSKFFSDVLPHTINVEIGDLTNTQSYSPKYCFDEQRNFSSQKSVEIRISEKEAVVPHDEKKVGSQRNLGPETVEFELPKKENGTSFDAHGKNSFEFAQFETPELDLFVETACIFKKEDMQIFSEVLEVQNIPDMLNLGLTVQYPFEIQESVYSVDDITPKYHMEQKACLLEDDASLGDQFQFYHWHISSSRRNSAIHPETVDDNFVLAVSLFLFEDLQFLDLNSVPDTYSIDSDLKSIDDGMLVLNFVFFGDAPNVPNTEEKKEMLNMPYGGILEIHGGPNEIASSKLLDDGFQERGNGEVLININADNASSLVQSMSQFNDLDFFLNPREASIGKISKPADKTSDIKATCPMISCSDSVAACDTAVARLQQWETKLYQIKLSDDILAVIDNFQKSYLTILKNDTELTNRQYSFLDADNFKFPSIPKEKLMDCIKKTSAHATSLGHGDDNGMAFVTLCAIKQMAWYLCYYGIHITYLYAGKLMSKSGVLEMQTKFPPDLD